MEGSVGKALHQARLQQKLTVEEVARGTKIRPARIVDLENDDYMHFPNLAYARSFLVLYAKYLRVDITKYPTVEVGSAVGTGDYQYLRSEEVESSPRRAHTEPVGPPEKPRWLIAFFVFVVMAVLGGIAGLTFMQFTRLGSVETLVKKDGEVNKAPDISLTPSPSPTPAYTPEPTPLPLSSGSEPIVPVQPGTAEGTPVLPAEPVNPAAATATPEVRRAEAAIPGSSDAEILAAAAAAATPTSVPAETPEATPAPQAALREIKIRVTRKTKIRIVRDNPKSPSLYFGSVNPLMSPLTFKGYYFWIKTDDPGALKVTVDGKPATGPESGVEIQ